MYTEIEKQCKPCPVCGEMPTAMIDDDKTTAMLKCECGQGFVYYAPNRKTKVTTEAFTDLVDSWNVAASM